MEYVRLGNTGLEVSRLCLGCMSFGDPTKGREWVMPLEPSRPIIKAAWDAGINFYLNSVGPRTSSFLVDQSAAAKTESLLAGLGLKFEQTGPCEMVSVVALNMWEEPGFLHSIAKALHDAGIPMLSQSVLLRGVNDDPATLEALMRVFVENRIKPYYLHHGDLAPGTAHLRTSIAEGQDLMRALQGRVSGLCQPAYVLDIPGGHGKTPIGPCNWTRSEDSGAGRAQYRVRNYSGAVHDYSDCLEAVPAPHMQKCNSAKQES